MTWSKYGCAVNRDSNRAKALGSALRLDATRRDEQIMRWAIDQLVAMQSTEGQAVLERYAAEVPSCTEFYRLIR